MIYSEIRCDGCAATGRTCWPAAPERAHMVRSILRGYGWRCGEPGGRDYCPECWEKMQAEKEKP